LFAIAGLLCLGILKGIDVSVAVATIVAAVAGANAYEAKGKPPQ